MITRLVLTVFAFLVLACQQGKCERQSTSAPLSPTQISTVEQRLFKQVYSYDPMEKRLQRLELLLFGCSQYGSKGQRWAHIQIALNDKKGEFSHAEANEQSAGADQSATISIIEKQILKAASPKEPAAKRLDKLESRVFGQTNSGMPIDQRIERLKRTIGMTSSLNPAISINPNDPEFPKQFQNNGAGSPFVFKFNGRILPDSGGFGMADAQISQMMKEMDRQMREFEEFGNGMPNGAPNGIQPNGIQENRRFFYYQFPSDPNRKPKADRHPNNSPKAQPNIPGLKTPNFDQLPPYSDPNMI